MRTPDIRLSFVRQVRKNSTCSVCGATKSIEFHHVRNKHFWLGDRKTVLSVPFHVVVREIQKCIPLCSPCHIAFHCGTLVVDVDAATKQHAETILVAKVVVKERAIRRKEKRVGRRRKRH